MAASPLTFLCISCYFKGEEFLRACKEAGNTVYLVTAKRLENKPWPRESIDETFYVESESDQWDIKELIGGLAFIMRAKKVDRIVALDDFDVEKAAHLREYFRIPGMGDTTGRHFRDKLAMRMRASDTNIPVPAFTSIFNDEDVNRFADSVPAPWLIKPRSEASATGIQKIHSKEQLWEAIHGLGEKRHMYLLEHFAPGDVYHVDSISYGGKIKFTRVSRYLNTPMEVAHGGGVFRSQTVEYGSDDDKKLQKFNAELMNAFNMKDGASHSEFIKVHATGEFVFLETASRVGGAHLAEMVEASSEVNLWREWARLETAIGNNEPYKLPKAEKKYAGIIISLSRHQHPDTSSFTDEEICWRMNEEYHIGLIIQSKSHARVTELLDKYAERIFKDFHAAAPLPDKPTH